MKGADRVVMYMKEVASWVRKRREARRTKNRSRAMWIRVTFSTLKVLAVSLVGLALYSVWFYYGDPAITTDYVELAKKLDSAPDAVGENAWPYYKKAGDLYIAPDKALHEILYGRVRGGGGLRRFADASAEEQDAVKRWVQDNDPAWREFEAGSSKSHCIPEWGHSDDEKLLVYLLPGSDTPFQLASVGMWRLRIAEAEGAVAASLRDCMTFIRVARQLLNTQSLRMRGLMFDKMGKRELLRLVGSTSVSSRTLRELQEELADMFDGSYPLPCRALERLFFLADVQRLFSQGGLGGGHLLPRSLRRYEEYDYILESSLSLGAIAYCYIVPYEYCGMIQFLEGVIGKNRTAALVRTAICLPHAGRRKTVAMANKLFDALEVQDKMTPHALNASEAKRVGEVADDLRRSRYWIVWMHLGSNNHWWAVEHYKGRALHGAIQAVLALRRWHLDKGAYPNTLEVLVRGGYLREVPMDPYSDMPLVYRRTAGDFILYSVGKDFKDDGGKADGFVRWGSGWMKGDTVFWPVSGETREVEDSP